MNKYIYLFNIHINKCFAIEKHHNKYYTLKIINLNMEWIMIKVKYKMHWLRTTFLDTLK